MSISLKHNFLDTLNPLCSCSLEVESTVHYFLHCPFFSAQRKRLFGGINALNIVLPISDNKLIDFLLYGIATVENDFNSLILTATIQYILDSGRFDGNLM